MDPAGQFAQLGKSRLRLTGRLVEAQGNFGIAVRPELGSRKPEGECQRNQPLLGPVMEIALKALPFGVTGRNDARSGGAHLI